MVLSKVYYRRTKRGNIFKVVREHYLRDDIGCGIYGCKNCSSNSVRLLSNVDSRSSPTNAVSNIHLLVVDSNIVLRQMDILEDDIFTDIVVPQVVVEEVKHQSPPAYKRLKDIFARTDKRFYCFYNEFCQDTYVERIVGETSNDRNDRAIRRVAKWYSEHLKLTKETSKVDSVLLSDDVENVKRASADGIMAISLAEYVNGIQNRPEILDKLVSINDQANREEKTKIGGRSGVQFPEYKSIAELRRGIKSGSYKQGSFQVSRENYLEATVYVGTGEREQIFIQGLLSCNRAIHDDIVAVELLPRDQWSCPAALLKLQELEADRGDAVSDDEDQELKSAVPKRGEKLADFLPTGRVIGILKRNWRPMCGMLEPSSVPGSTRYLFIPAERRIPRVRIETRQAARLLGQRIIVSIDSWPRNSRYPCGHFVRALGTLGDKQTENEVLLLEHDVPHGPFSTDVLNCLPQMPWKITEHDVEARKDFRHLDIVSIDPPGCTDIDDALHCRLLEDDNGSRLEIGVHIADVSHFVRPATAIDLEARERGTTVYLVDRRIDMLPTLLSSNLCSLRADEERLTFSVIWEMTENADILKTTFCKSTIKSKAAMTYAEAQCQIDDASRTDALSTSLRRLNAIAKRLKDRRIAKGALSLASLEIRFRIDSETHEPIDVQAKQMLETNSLVEEFMLLANTSVAEYILKEFPDCALLRRHQTPPPSNFEPLIKAAAARGFTISVDTGKALAESLDKAVIPENPFFNTLLRILATRCMTQARYFCSGTVERDQFGHYGLASPIYTHFTSPIRRYADLMVHRLLAAAIGAADTYPQMLNKQENANMCEKLNTRHRNAQYAARASVLLNTHLFFKEKVENLEGYVLSLRKNAFKVLLPKYGLESAVLLKKDCPLKYDADSGTLIGPDDLRLHLFDPVLVRLSVDTKDAQHEKMKLELIKPNVAGFSVEPIVSAGEEPISKKWQCQS